MLRQHGHSRTLSKRLASDVGFMPGLVAFPWFVANYQLGSSRCMSMIRPLLLILLIFFKIFIIFYHWGCSVKLINDGKAEKNTLSKY